MALPPSSQALRQVLSLTPNPSLGIPDLSKVHPMMIGPITDLLTFYADMLIAKSQGKLARAGDHFYFKHGTPNSWADGTYVTLGQDSIDFDVTLAEVDRRGEGGHRNRQARAAGETADQGSRWWMEPAWRTRRTTGCRSARLVQENFLRRWAMKPLSRRSK